MIDASGDVLYVGKARNLKKRVAAYASPGRLGPRLHRMVADTGGDGVRHHPHRGRGAAARGQPDQAAAPALQHPAARRQVVPLHPRHRRPCRSRGCSSIAAPQSRPGDYFGPFASTWAVNRTLTALQRAFLLRSCSDAVFAARTRPCLLYQIKRCSAPCVGRIGEADYAALVEEARAFLKGDSQRVQQELAQRMEAASARARLRGSGALPRPHPRADRGAVASGHQPRTASATPTSSPSQQAGSRRLRPGVLLPRRLQLRQPRLLSGQRRRRGRRRRCWRPSSASSTTAASRRRCILLSHALPNQALVAEALSVRAGRRVEVVDARSAAPSTTWSANAARQRPRGARPPAGRERLAAPAAGGAGPAARSGGAFRSASRSTTTATSAAPTRWGR